MTGSPETRMFGTDGIRGRFGEFPLDEPTVVALGRRLALEAPRVVLGGDTRESTPTLCAWIARGLAAGGAEVHNVGVVPTAGIAALVREVDAAAGVVVSASHNPYPDNGIKLIDAGGFKWSEEREAELEADLRRVLGTADAPGAAALPGSSPGDSSGAGSLGDPEGALVHRYLDGLAATVGADEGRRPLAGLRIALDTGNGAASPYAGDLFARLGAQVEVIHASPDGTNVNRGCGSTDTADLARTVVEGAFHLGAAFDGDADRAILVDAAGSERDGDAILYLWASALDAAGALEPRSIVATSMSNLGLEVALGERGIEVVRCGVGDRLVVETMRREGIVLGGEQSGHIVHLGHTTTGDGLLTTLQVAALAARAVREADATKSGAYDPLTDLLQGFRRYPQVLVNVEVREKPDLSTLPAVERAAEEVEERLGEHGRLVLRYSGTEPLARVMIEGPDQDEIERLAGRIADAIRTAISA